MPMRHAAKLFEGAELPTPDPSLAGRGVTKLRPHLADAYRLATIDR